MIRAEDGEYVCALVAFLRAPMTDAPQIVKQLAAGVAVKISFPPIGAVTGVEDAEVGGLISYFSRCAFPSMSSYA